MDGMSKVERSGQNLFDLIKIMSSLYISILAESCQKGFHNDHLYVEDKLLNKCLLNHRKESMIPV